MKKPSRDTMTKAMRGELPLNKEIEEVCKQIKAEQTHRHQGHVSESASAIGHIQPNQKKHPASSISPQSGHTPFPESGKPTDTSQDWLSKEHKELISRRFQACQDLSPLINASWRLAQKTMLARILQVSDHCNTCNDLMVCSEKAEGILGTQLKVDTRKPYKKPEENPFCCNDGPFGSSYSHKSQTCNDDNESTSPVNKKEPR